METNTSAHVFDSAEAWKRWLTTTGIVDTDRARRQVEELLTSGVPLDLVDHLLTQSRDLLKESNAPDEAFENLSRFIRAGRSPQATAALFERDSDSMPTLLRIFSVSQYMADQLIADPESFDLLRMTEGQPIQRNVLVDEICAEVTSARDESQAIRVLQAFHQREVLRIAFGDFIGRMPFEVVTQQNSFLAESICEAAYRAAWKLTTAKHGVPTTWSGDTAHFAVVATGQLGGNELSYSDNISLSFIAELDGKTDGSRSIPNREFFERMTSMLVRLVSEGPSGNDAYRVDLRLRPHGLEGPLVADPHEALQYYDAKGRTWERQAFVKARSVAGDREWSDQWLKQLSSWVYRRYLSRADLSGIRALKRRIEQRAEEHGVSDRDVVEGHGGIRDIEFVIQFLQLLNGGDWEPVRLTNTLEAISMLEQMGCLTPRERSTLEEGYRFLRRIKHHLQILSNLENRCLPEDASEFRRLAYRLGFRDSKQVPAQIQFQNELSEKARLNRLILDHLMHEAFGDDESIPDETYLVLDPQPSLDRIDRILSHYGFSNSQAAYRQLQELAKEEVAFLSTRRCRHFLAGIAPKLLAEIAKTPSPEMTLNNLVRVSKSLGGKAILWELFSSHLPTLQLGVRLCAASPYLVGILTGNPGMIDELMDSLMLGRLPKYETLSQELAELCRGAEDIEPIVHQFKQAMHLRIGVRDVLGKEDVTAIHHALADVADVCLEQIVVSEYQRLVQRHGVPSQATSTGQESAASENKSTELAVIALGKLGGREPNYHSDLELLFLYESDGTTRGMISGARYEVISNQSFYSQLASRVSQAVNRLTPLGRLYEMDTRVRGLGNSAISVFSSDAFTRYFEEEQDTFKRQLLCKARAVWGSPAARKAAMATILSIVIQPQNSKRIADTVRKRRLEMEQGATSRNIKRGVGGTLDVEYLVQMLQLIHMHRYPELFVPGTLEAVQQLQQKQLLSTSQAVILREGYHALRSIESGLRLMNTPARHDLPVDTKELNQLAFLLGYGSGEQVMQACDHARQNHRTIFLDIVSQQEEFHAKHFIDRRNSVG